MSLFTSIASPKTIKKLHTVNYKDLEKAGIKLRCARLGFIIDLRYKEKIKLLNEVLSLFKNYIEIYMTSDMPEECPIAHFVEIDFYYEESDDELYQIFLSNIEPLKNYIFTQENGHDKLANVYITAYKKIKSYDILIKGCKDTLNTAEEGPQKMLVQKILALDLASREENKKKKTQAYNRKLKFRENKTRIDLELNSKDLEMFQNIKEKEYLRSNIDVLRYLMNLYENSTDISEDSELETFETFYKLYLEAADKLNLYAKNCNRGEKDKIPTTGMHTIRDLVSTANETIGRIKNLHKTFMQAELKKVVKIDNINRTYRSNITQLENNEIDTLDIVNIFTAISNMTEPHTKNR